MVGGCAVWSVCRFGAAARHAVLLTVCGYCVVTDPCVAVCHVYLDLHRQGTECVPESVCHQRSYLRATALASRRMAEASSASTSGMHSSVPALALPRRWRTRYINTAASAA